MVVSSNQAMQLAAVSSRHIPSRPASRPAISRVMSIHQVRRLAKRWRRFASPAFRRAMERPIDPATKLVKIAMMIQ